MANQMYSVVICMCNRVITLDDVISRCMMKVGAATPVMQLNVWCALCQKMYVCALKFGVIMDSAPCDINSVCPYYTVENVKSPGQPTTMHMLSANTSADCQATVESR